MKFGTGTVGGVLAMALVWGLVWAVPGGVLEAIDNVAPAAHGFTRRVDMWMQTLGLPGLMAGVAFSVLLLVTGGRRRFAEVALSRAVAWGAVAGLLVSVLVVWGLDSGLSEPLVKAVVVMGYATVMGGVAGVASVVAFRYAGQKLAPASS